MWWFIGPEEVYVCLAKIRKKCECAKKWDGFMPSMRSRHSVCYIYPVVLRSTERMVTMSESEIVAGSMLRKSADGASSGS